MSLQYAANTIASWDVAEAFETRLKLGLSDSAQNRPKPASGFVRWMTAPDQDDGAALKAEDGVHLVLGDPQPITKDGAGRAGKRVRRIVQVWIVTRSNQDKAGDVRIALEKHTTLEDLVFDSLDDVIPDGFATGQQNTVGITCHWMPGGDDIKRKKKIAPDVFVSVHLFEIIYPQRLRVNRVAFA